MSTIEQDLFRAENEVPHRQGWPENMAADTWMKMPESVEWSDFRRMFRESGLHSAGFNARKYKGRVVVYRLMKK